MKLIYNSISPFARMCLITARELRLDKVLELIPMEGMSPQAPKPELLHYNPLGRVPALITDHGHAIHDSRVICEYFTHRAGNKSLLPDEPVRRFRILTIQSLGQGMAEIAVAMRYELAARPDSARWPELVLGHQQRLAAAWDDLEQHWIKEVKEVTLGSIAVAAALAYVDFRHGQLGWRTHHPKLAEWFAQFSARPSMAP
jgi:glutathione S-transferase